MVALRERPLDYASERLFWDEAFQQQLLGGMLQLGRDVEKALGGEPQVRTPLTNNPPAGHCAAPAAACTAEYAGARLAAVPRVCSRRACGVLRWWVQ